MLRVVQGFFAQEVSRGRGVQAQVPGEIHGAVRRGGQGRGGQVLQRPKPAEVTPFLYNQKVRYEQLIEKLR